MHVGGASSRAIAVDDSAIPDRYYEPNVSVPAGVVPHVFPERQDPAYVSGDLIDACVCGSSNFEGTRENNLDVRTCLGCGIKHQIVHMTPEQLEAWYRDQYYGYRVDTGRLMDRDLTVARSRLDTYQIKTEGPILDIGTANGAFVVAARERGLDAWGQDLSAEALGPHVYSGRLPDIHFPTDHFQVVTIQDVLEHVVDPYAFVAEAHRMTRQGGLLIIDIPDFDSPDGLHHWKQNEHVWLFSEQQLRSMCERIGFDYVKTLRPIPGRYMMFLSKRTEKRVSILVAPGIGDSYWALGKIPDFCRQHGLGLPDVWVSDLGDKKRSLEGVQKVSLVHGAGYRQGSHKSAVWQEAYMLKGRALFRDHCQCDYFLAANGGLRHGLSMEQILPQYKMEWYLPLFRSKVEDAMEAQAKSQWGRYVVAYFLDVGMYKYWINTFGLAKIVDCLRRIQRALDVRIVFTGAPWDHGQFPTKLAKHCNDPANFIDFTGKTDFDQMLGLYRGSVGAIGFPSGSTIMGNILKVPSLIFWSKYFDKNFWRHCMTPESLGQWYEMADTGRDMSTDVAKRFVELVKRNEGVAR